MKSKLAVLITVALLSVMSVSSAVAIEAMPYTDEALRNLNAAMERTPAPKEIQGNYDYNVRTYIERHRKAFALAGYDYERSVMRIINDIQFDRYVANKASLRLYLYARELLRLHVRTNITPRKYLNSDCASLLIDFRDFIRRNSNKYGSC